MCNITRLCVARLIYVWHDSFMFYTTHWCKLWLPPVRLIYLFIWNLTHSWIALHLICAHLICEERWIALHVVCAVYAINRAVYSDEKRPTVLRYYTDWFVCDRHSTSYAPDMSATEPYSLFTEAYSPEVLHELICVTRLLGITWVAVCCSVLQCVAVCCSVLQCVAVCCSV